jgi:hypothetical protein
MPKKAKRAAAQPTAWSTPTAIPDTSMHRASQATHEKHYGSGSWMEAFRNVVTGTALKTLKNAGK